MKISSVQVEVRGGTSPYDVGAHERVTVWVDGKQVGTLVVGPGEGETLRRLLLAAPSLTLSSGSKGLGQK